MAHEKKDINSLAGQRVRMFRKILGLSQTELASRLDFSYQQLQKYEAGRSQMSITTLERLGEALQKSADDILGAEASDQLTKVAKVLMSNASEEISVEDRCSEEITQIAILLKKLNNSSINRAVLQLLKSFEE